MGEIISVQLGELIGIRNCRSVSGSTGANCWNRISYKSRRNLGHVNEFEDGESIQSENAFINPAGIESKYFSTSLEGAQSYASQATSAFGDGPFSFVQTSIPTSSITSEMAVTVDSGIQTIVVPSAKLPSLSAPVILPPP